MTWLDDIEAALHRGKSPYTFKQVFGWLRDGDATMYAGDDMHGGIWWKGPNGPEIAWLAGKWNSKDAAAMIMAMHREMKERGIEFVGVKGRKGWQRFLRMKGVEYVGRG